MAAKENEERKVAASSYVIQFYQNVQQLGREYANYCNVLEELEFRYGSQDIDKLEDADRTTTIQVTQSLKYYVRHVYIQWKTASKATSIEKKEAEAIEKTYKKLLSDFVPKKVDVEEFVIQINQYMASSVMKDLLSSSQDIVESLYD